MKKRFLITLRSFLIVSLSTATIYVIANHKYILALILSGFISIMWTLNSKDLAIADWKDRIAYVLGGIVGTTTTLYFPIIFN